MMVAPFMIRGPVLERWRDYRIKEILSGEEQKKYIRWENAVMDHPAVKACLHDINMIVEVNYYYLDLKVYVTYNIIIDVILMCVSGIRIICERNPNRHKVTS